MDEAEDLRVLAGIRLEGELGKGRFGPVERGFHLTLARPVAVRAFTPAVSEDAEAMERLNREARALAQLDHPALVRVYDGGEADGRGYLAMELVEGGVSLARKLPLKLPDAVAVTRAVAEVLAWAHDRGVVHGGVSAHAVLVDPDGKVRLSDFGLAHLAAGRAGMPEPDADADIVAAARLLSEVAGADDGEGLPARFRAVVDRATGGGDGLRFASMRELIRALDDAMATRELPRREQRWLRVIAVAQAVAVLALLWAVLAGAAPEVLVRNMLAPGALLSPGRSWLGMALLAFGAAVLAGGGTAWLWRRWRASGLDRGDPAKSVSAGDAAFGLGVLALFAHGVRLLRLDAALDAGEAVAPSLPAATLFFLVLTLGFAAAALLEVRRRSRPLRREGYLWGGVVLGLLPVLVELVR